MAGPGGSGERGSPGPRQRKLARKLPPCKEETARRAAPATRDGPASTETRYCAEVTTNAAVVDWPEVTVTGAGIVGEVTKEVTPAGAVNVSE